MKLLIKLILTTIVLIAHYFTVTRPNGNNFFPHTYEEFVGDLVTLLLICIIWFVFGKDNQDEQ